VVEWLGGDGTVLQIVSELGRKLHSVSVPRELTWAKDGHQQGAVAKSKVTLNCISLVL
jgi:hypothetical protein